MDKVKDVFASLRKVSLFDRILASTVIIGLLFAAFFIISSTLEEEQVSREEILEVYSFRVDGVITFRCIEEVGGETEVCPIIQDPISYTSHVIANTSRGLIKDQGLESVAFLPPRTLIVVAFFDFLNEPFEYHGLIYSSPSSSPTN